MRILIDALSILPAVNLGGETYIQGLLRGFSEVAASEEFLVVCTRLNRSVFPAHLPRFEFRTLNVDNRRRGVRVLFEQLVLPFLALRWNADVVFFPGNMIAALLLPLGVPSVVTIHDVGADFYRRTFPGYMPRWKVGILLRLLRFAARHATAVVVPSEFAKQELVRHAWRPAEEIVTIHSGTPEFPAASPDDVLRRLNLSRPYVLSVGAVNKHKNLERLVQAFMVAKRQLGSAHTLVIVGPPGNGIGDLQRVIAAENAAEQVRLVGYLAAEDLGTVYRNAAVFAMPSLYEGFGFPALEAMRFSVPLLLSRAASLPELAQESAWYVDPTSADDIASSLQRLLSDDSLRNEMAQRGLQQAARFRWRETAQRTLGVLRSAAAVTRNRA